MYESFFGLGKRPFAATPDPGCFVSSDGAYQTLSQLAQCAADGRGIGVLTALAGMGKTLVAQRLIRDLESRFAIVYLPTGNFLTRRSLLQAILFELGHSFVRMGDQELRLALTSALRRVRPSRQGVVLIVDEAHLLAPRMLEELRALTNIAESGEPLLRLVICGQVPLEETLSQPAMTALNQRIGCQVMLLPLTRAESIEYVSRRLAWAGGNLSEILNWDSLLTICEASDGSPRCLNQLCDHSLLLAYLASEKPVTVRKVRKALDELKQLPLTWNEPTTDHSAPTSAEAHRPAISTPEVRTSRETSVHEISDEPLPSIEIEIPNRESASEVLAVEFGEDFDSPITVSSPPAIELRPLTNLELPAIPMTAFTLPAIREEFTVQMPRKDADGPMVDEEVVIDRYAALDAAVGRLARTMLCASAVIRRSEAMIPAAVASKSASPVVAEEPASVAAVYDIVMPEEVPVSETTVTASRSSSRAPMQKRVDPPKPRSGERRYQYLFSELRRRREAAFSTEK